MTTVFLKLIALTISYWMLSSILCTAQTPADVELFKIIARGAEEGDANSQCMLAMYYAKGVIVPMNEKECVRWTLRAAKQGHIGAQRTLSIFYRVGTVLEKNLVASYMWAEIAVNQSSPPDKAAVGLRFDLGIMMKPEEIAVAKKAAQEFKPVKESR